MSRYRSTSSRNDHDHDNRAQHFTISDADFERDAVLKRRRYLSPPKSPGRALHHQYATSNEPVVSSRIRTRSKSKSRGRESALRRLPSMNDQEFIALGRQKHTSSRPTSSSTRGRSPSSSRTRSSAPVSKSSERGRTREREPSESRVSTRTRSKSKSRDVTKSSSTTRSKSSSRRERSPSSSPDRRERKRSKSVSRHGKEKARSKSKARSTTSSSGVATTAISTASTTDQELQHEVERTAKKLDVAKRELVDLEDELADAQKRVDAKKYEVLDLQIVMDGLEKRRALQQQFMRQDSLSSIPSTPMHRRHDEERRTKSSDVRTSSRGSKRPRIVDEEDDDDDNDVVIVEPPRAPVVKEEVRAASSSSLLTSTARRVSPDVPPPAARKRPNDQMSDHFWGRVDVAKLLVQPRIRNIPDGSARKGRHLAFNPIQQDVFATGSDDGGLILWNYSRHNQDVSKVVSFAPTSFRKDAQCAESIAWSPDGDRLAIAFRDPVDSLSEFCVVRLHQLALTDSLQPQTLPRDRLKTKSTTLHSRGISAIEWIPSGYGDGVGSRGLVTAGSDHNLVMWEEHEELKSQADFKWRVLHREHRSDVRSICMHSQRNAIYTGGLDGLVIRYDMNTFKTYTIMERRRPHISKINAVLENPHNPNLLLISSVEQAEHNLLLHDLRERYDDRRQSTMTLSWLRSSDAKSMSQYIVPRWSPGGFHVSCGSTSGLVNIWDVRVRGPQYPLVHPQQTIQVHQKQVLHATWHPRYDAMFSVSHDRSIGLLTFR